MAPDDGLATLYRKLCDKTVRRWRMDYKTALDWGHINAPPTFLDAFHLLTVMASWERSAIEQMLVKTGGAKAEAARRLGLSKSDLTYKLAQLAATKMQ